MSELGTLYLLCGKMAAGKSTLARELARTRDAILLSEDRLLSELYPGEVGDLSSYVQCSNRVKAALETHIVALLRRGVSVVLDFPGNTRRQREWMRRLLASSGAPHELHLLVVSDAVCKSRLARRAAEQPEHRATDTVELFEAVTAHFQPPAPDEGFRLVQHEASQGAEAES